MAGVDRIRKEDHPSGVRYVVDYCDNTGRRSTRRFKRSRDAEAVKKQVEASTYTGWLPPRPVQVTVAQWAEEWFAQQDALCRAGQKPRPSTLNSGRSDVQSLPTALGGYALHDLTADVASRYVDHLQDTPIPVGRRSGGQRLRDLSIRHCAPRKPGAAFPSTPSRISTGKSCWAKRSVTTAGIASCL